MEQPNGTRHIVEERSSETALRSRSPFAVIWMFTAIVLCLLILANFSFGVLSSVRAYVGGESRWSKAQKDAVFDLQRYAVTRAPADLQRFHGNISVLMGDHAARIEMNKAQPDIQNVRLGFISG